MARVPYLDRDQVPPELQTVYDTTQKAIGRVPNFHKVLAHSPKALTGYLGLSAALREMKLDAKLRELAYLKSAQLNHCHY
ncbi:MAG: carboxymuconolactone decarboxylase family protein [Candidatus Rokubacteria bacterium]|nr:carboxymuconolactone decarboxylase family protein [Candidatus Rokubacteria bacterium]